jgi:hypothetical protein
MLTQKSAWAIEPDYLAIFDLRNYRWTLPLYDTSRASQFASAVAGEIGLAREGAVIDGCVVRQKRAYPVYDDDYERHVATIRTELDQRYPNLHLVGRNGMHKYNNQDHAMMTAMLCVENILARIKLYDLWQVNSDAEYHEGDGAEKEPAHGTAIGWSRCAPQAGRPSWPPSKAVSAIIITHPPSQWFGGKSSSAAK